MAAALALQHVDRIMGPGGVTRRYYLVTLTGNYTNQANGGETIDFTKATNPFSRPHAIPGRVPIKYNVNSHPVGLEAKIIPGTTNANWSLQMFYKGAGSAEFVEKSNGEAYAAGATGDTNFLICIESKVNM